MNVLALSDRKCICLKTKKADQKHCENWRVNLVQNSTNIPECASEVSGGNSCEMYHLKFETNTPWLRYLFDAFLV